MTSKTIELDNLQAGDDVVVDDIAGSGYQYVKMAYGADNTATIVTSTATNPFPVALSDTDNAVLDTIDAVLDTINAKLVTGTVIGDVNLGATDNAVLDDIAAQNTTVAGAVSAGQMQVDIVADGAGLLTTSAHDAAFGTAGTADAQVRSVQGIAGGTALPVSGTVTANPASGTIDTVTNLAQMGAAAISMNTGVRDAGTQRVTIATDDSVPVTGTVTANPASGTIDTVTTITTANLAAETTKVIGTVRMASGGVASGAFASGALASGAVTDLPLPTGAATSANQDARATGGHTYYTNTDTSALDTIKASAGTLYWLHVTSTDATPVFVTFYDATSPTLGTSPVLCFPIPTQGDANGAGLTINFGPHGIQFTNSIKIGAATTFNGSTDPGTNVVITNVGFE